MERIILVTGAASGMGLATTKLLRDKGNRVIGVDMKQADGINVVADLSTKDGRLAAVEQIMAIAPGYIDGAVTWAGIGTSTEKTIPINYFGQVDVLSGIRPLLEKSDAPRVVITSSRNSLYPHSPQLVELCLAGKEAEAIELANCLMKNCTEGDARRLPYISSKAASTIWMRRNASAPEWGGKGILINAIAPGLIITPMTQASMEPGPIREWLIKEHPQVISAGEYSIYAEDMAHLCAFLLSAEQSILVGQILYADFGCEVMLRGESTW